MSEWSSIGLSSTDVVSTSINGFGFRRIVIWCGTDSVVEVLFVSLIFFLFFGGIWRSIFDESLESDVDDTLGLFGS